MANQGHTIRLHRVLKAPIERVFRAFTEADAKASWLPPYGFVCKIHSFNPVVGGKYRMSFINFTTQQGHTFGGEFLEIVPGKLLTEMCYLGWQESLTKLAHLVEPEIKQ